jgi:exodeoxyribonuclease VII small subunit
MSDGTHENSQEAAEGLAGADPALDYESATNRLDRIIARLDSGQAQLRETLDLCTEAKGLIEFCAAELAAVDRGLNELNLEDLAESLKGEGPDSSAPVGTSNPAPPVTGDPGPEEPPF